MPPLPPNTGAVERERLLAFSFTNADLLIELDAHFNVIFASGAIQHLTGRDERSVIGIPVTTLFEARERPLVAVALGGLRPNARLGPMESGLKAQKGKDVPIRFSAYRLAGEVPRYFVTILMRARSAKEQSERDHLDVQSGLLDGERFAGMAAQVQSKHPDSKLTMIELGNFGALAERLGDESLDDFMGEAGTLLREASLDGETAGRIGPDKLGFVHGAKVDPSTVEARINQASRKADPSGAGLNVARWTMPLSGSGLSPEQMSQVLRFAISSFAEKGLEEFKPASMNAVMHDLVSATLARVAQVRDTIDSGQIEIAYQPIVNLKDRRLHHWEALCRHDEDESPQGVVRFAEQTGMAIEFDLLVVSKVMAALQAASERGLKPYVAVNLSARSIENTMFLTAFRDLLKPFAGLQPQLMIEITETERLSDLARADAIIQEFRRQRMKVCLDDFGAGASSFSYVQSLAVDALKIDGAYVRPMLSNPRDAAIIRAIVQLCAELRISSVAEMIENEQQAAKLTQLGVDHGQGFLFGHPNRSEDFEAARPPAPLNLRRKGVTETWQ